MLGSSSTNSTRGFTPTNLATDSQAFPRFNPRLPGAWPEREQAGAMRFSRTSLAAVLTIVALGALAAVALASGGSDRTTAPRPTSETDPPALIAAPAGDDGTADQGRGDARATRHDAAERRHDRGRDD